MQIEVGIGQFGTQQFLVEVLVLHLFGELIREMFSLTEHGLVPTTSVHVEMEIAAIDAGVGGVAPGEHIENEVIWTEESIVVSDGHISH